MEEFMKVYEQKLINNVKANPKDYWFGVEGVPIVIEKMREAIKKGSFNKDSLSIKETCKELKIKHTYKAIFKFIEESRGKEEHGNPTIS